MDVHFRRQNHLSDTIISANDRIVNGVIIAANKYGLFNHNRDPTDGLRIAGHDNHLLSHTCFRRSRLLGKILKALAGMHSDCYWAGSEMSMRHRLLN